MKTFGQKSTLKMIFIFLLPFIGGFIILARMSISNWFSIDTCLDSGGRWNYESKLCEKEALPNGWRLPKAEELSSEWRNSDPDRFAKVKGDFNGDGKTDLAGLCFNEGAKKTGVFIWWDGDVSTMPMEVTQDEGDLPCFFRPPESIV